MTNRVSIEFVLALADIQTLLKLKLEKNSNISDMLEILNSNHKDIALQVQHFLEKGAILGVFSQRVAVDYILQEGDRVELYRALVVDPKTARARRAKLKNNSKVVPK
ncbi:hypothetical protein AwWohl_14820 [Gammaproteobacteria bacterium]|nr:hypothetical protein AwWohl_14820 [Gammaproteobacteria bacterium]